MFGKGRRREESRRRARRADAIRDFVHLVCEARYETRRNETERVSRTCDDLTRDDVNATSEMYTSEHGASLERGKLTELGGDPATKRVLGTTERLVPRRREPPPAGGWQSEIQSGEREAGRGLKREGERPESETETECAQSQIRKPRATILITSFRATETNRARSTPEYNEDTACAFKAYPSRVPS